MATDLSASSSQPTSSTVMTDDEAFVYVAPKPVRGGDGRYDSDQDSKYDSAQDSNAEGKGNGRRWFNRSKGKKKEKNIQPTGVKALLSRSFVKQVKISDISPDDVVVAIMGPTGSGKSSARFTEGVGHSLESCTSEIKVVRLSFPEVVTSDICFVDTPGFDDTNKSDLDIFKMISDWMNTTYQKKIHLSALLYFHRISDNRMAGTPLKNLRMFEKVCGKDFTKIILTTTMWDEVDKEVGLSREQELRSVYWKTMIDLGSSVGQFHATRASAFEILGPLIQEVNTRDALLLQVEMNDLGKTLRQTSAGATLYNELEDLVGRRQKMLERIREEMNHPQTDESQLQLLMDEYKDITDKWRAAQEDMAQLKVSVGERLKKAFGFSFTWKKLLNIRGSKHASLNVSRPAATTTNQADVAAATQSRAM